MADYNLGPFRPYPKDEYDDTASYRFLDIVNYRGSCYMCKNEDTIDGTACIGIAPTGESQSDLYWMCIAEKGDAALASDYEYQGFTTVSDLIWDYDLTDKIVVPENVSGTLSISNVYDGCCGLVVTKSTNMALPSNSVISIDFDYVTLQTGQIYLYSFVYCDYGIGGQFLWNRTVMDESVE